EFDSKGLSLADQEFHGTIVASSHNRFILDAWEGLHAFMHVHRLYALHDTLDHHDAEDEHAKILAVARSGDREKLARALEQHLVAAALSIANLTHY
ncbi:MAG: FCD domain-containing protein, partial [Gaiellales bacterium]